MKRISALLTLAFLLCLSPWGRAQELDCKVNIVTSKVTSGDKSVFETLTTVLNQFMNGRRWTNLNFRPQEKIPCSMTIDVQEYNSSNGQVKAYLTVQLRRPCFKATYTSLLLNTVDKDFSFSYVKNDPIEFSDNSIGTNLTATMAFYAYLILGNYFDSFAPRGGSVFYEKANNIVLQAQGMSEQGWRSSERNERNRYWISESYSNSNYQAIHEVLYRYFRLGMDMMFDDPATARVNITEALSQLSDLKRKRPNLPCIQLFMESRADELVNIFQPAEQAERQKAFDLLVSIDAANVNTYKKILANSSR